MGKFLGLLKMLTNTSKIAHKESGLDSLPLAFYVGVKGQKHDECQPEKVLE